MAILAESAINRLGLLNGGSDEGPRCFFSPARVNLIGDHVDYCGGLVLPAAIQFGTTFAVRPNDVGRVRVVSSNQPGIVEFDPGQANEPLRSGHTWGNYVMGVFEAYRPLIPELPDLDISICGDIPGSCLSSSASLGVGIALILEACSGYASEQEDELNRRAIARRVQHAENNFVGMNCGIMDQAAIVLGRADHAMRMDCSDLEVEYIPVASDVSGLLIADTRKDRALVESAYNQRRSEVERSLEIITQRFPVTSLCQLTIEQLPEVFVLLDDPLLIRRVRHVVTEHRRVEQSAVLLRNGDLDSFGPLLNLSHSSLCEDYEVTGIELDTLMGLLQKQAGVHGARMMGAGFGGCGIAVIQETALERIMETVTPAYRDRIGYEPAFYPVEIVDGAHEIVSPV